MTPNFSISGSAGFDITTELYSDISGSRLIRDMKLMADTDETVGAMMYCISTILAQIDWTYTPMKDGKEAPEDADAQKWADFATSLMIDLDRPFKEHLDDFLTMLWAGFAPCEIVTKQRDGVVSQFSDNYYGLKSLNLIDQSTIWDFIYTDDRKDLVGMKQMAVGQTGDGQLPLFKFLLYRTNAQYNNPRGRPLLKSAWRVWKLKRKIQDSEALGIERELCGLPVFEMPEEVMERQFEVDGQGNSTQDALKAQAMIRAAMSAVKDLRFNQSGGLVIPSNTYADDVPGDKTRMYNFKIVTSAGQRSIDSRTAARDYDHAIARVAMMQFLTLGQRSGGSYGLSEDQSSSAVESVTALAKALCAEWNAKVISLIWTVNGFPNQYRPRLTHSPISKNGIVQLGTFLAGLGKAADFWAGDAKMRTSMARAAGLDYDYDAQAGAASNVNEQDDAATELAKNPPPPPPTMAPGAANPKTPPKPAARRAAAANED